VQSSSLLMIFGGSGSLVANVRCPSSCAGTAGFPAGHAGDPDVALLGGPRPVGGGRSRLVRDLPRPRGLRLARRRGRGPLAGARGGRARDAGAPGAVPAGRRARPRTGDGTRRTDGRGPARRPVRPAAPFAAGTGPPREDEPARRG